MAVAFDNSQRTAFTGGTVASLTTASYTFNSTTNGILFGATFQDQSSQSDNSTTATYNGASMTKVGTQGGSGAGFTGGMGLFAIVGQSANATATFNFSPNTRVGCHLMSFTGANQSTTLDSSSSGAPATVNLTASTTVVANNCMLYLAAIDDTGALATGGTNTTLQIAGGSGDNSAYSTALVNSGSQSLAITDAATHWTYIIVSIAAPGAAASHFFNLLGVGT